MPRTRPKGTGAHYGQKIKRLSDTHVQILRILAHKGPLTKQQVTATINEDAKKLGLPLVGGFSVSGRLSELCGAGLVSMRYAEVKLHDRETMKFRFRKKPVWDLTPHALEFPHLAKIREKTRDGESLLKYMFAVKWDPHREPTPEIYLLQEAQRFRYMTPDEVREYIRDRTEPKSIEVASTKSLEKILLNQLRSD